MTSRPSSRQAFASKAAPYTLAGSLVFATPLGGCVVPKEERACTLAGCETRIGFELGPRERVLDAAWARGPLAVRACVDAACAETTIARAGTCEHAPAPGDSPFRSLVCDATSRPQLRRAPVGTTFDLDLRLGMGERSWGEAPVASVTIRSSSGEPLYQTQREVRFEPRYVNGRGCGITCWETPSLPLDVSGALAAP